MALKVFLTLVNFFLLLSLSSQAQSIPVKGDKIESKSSDQEETLLEKTEQVVQEATQTVSDELSKTKAIRLNSKYFVIGNYSLVDLIIPNKYGVTLGKTMNVDRTWEIEYLRGSVSVPFLIKDLGKMTDERFSIMGRSYFGTNSFNMSYGLTFFNFSMHLGDKLLSQLSGGAYPSIDLVQLQSLGFNLAVGNRWAINKNVTIGVDWLSWAQPLFITKQQSAFLDYATNQEDKEDVDKAISLISYFPRFALMKFHIGILF